MRRFPEKMIPRSSEYFRWSSSPRQRVSRLIAGSLDSRLRGNDGKSEVLAWLVYFLTPDAQRDANALKEYAFDLPDQATITGDKAYNDYGYEDLLEEADLHWVPSARKIPNAHSTPP